MTEPAIPDSSAAQIFGSDRMWGLKELPLPQPIALWPQTWGWAVVAALVLAVFALMAWWRWRRWQGNAYRRDGAARLDRIIADQSLIGGLPEILRMAALCGFDRADIASLRGRAWIDWLNHTAGRKLFDEQAGMLLDRLPFVPDPTVHLDRPEALQLIEAARAWMKEHHASA